MTLAAYNFSDEDFGPRPCQSQDGRSDRGTAYHGGGGDRIPRTEAEVKGVANCILGSPYISYD